MRAVLLGTGSPPPNPKRRGPATLLALGNETFLVDAGSGVGVQLVQAGVRPYDWPRVLITHHHSDHMIDLGHLLITRWISGQNAPFEIWGPAGTKRQMDKLPNRPRRLQIIFSDTRPMFFVTICTAARL